MKKKSFAKALSLALAALMLFALCACGAAGAPAAAAVKKYLAATGKSGTVIFFGRPGEEGGAAKAYMVREKLRYEPDAVPVAL